MNDRDLGWLLRCADRLSTDAGLPLDVEAIFRRWGIQVRAASDTSGREGITSRTRTGEYIVTVFTHTAASRERFTLAHELAHVLVEEKFGWDPTTEREYYQREEWCNRFAARLLVPEAVVQKGRMDSITTAIQSVLWLSRICGVSREVAARRLGESWPEFGLAELEECTDKKGSRRVRVRWAAPEIPACGLRRRRLLDQNYSIATAVFSGSPDQRFVDVASVAARAMVCRSKLVPNRHLLWYQTQEPIGSECLRPGSTSWLSSSHVIGEAATNETAAPASGHTCP